MQPTRSMSTPLADEKGKELEERKKKHMIIFELENKHILCEHLIYIMEYKKIEVKHENKK